MDKYKPQRAYDDEVNAYQQDDQEPLGPKGLEELLEISDADWEEFEKSLYRDRPSFKGLALLPGEDYDAYFKRFLDSIRKNYKE